MKPFAYQRPSEAAAAVAAVAGRRGARFLGGGTNLVDLMKLGVETPEVLVDVSRLPLGGVEMLEDGTLRIGAGVRNSDLVADAHVRRSLPMLAEAVLDGASGQLRNVATVGGNLLQRTRCGYFQDVSKPCNKRVPGSGCPAIAGQHRNLAILGASESCVATHPSDMAVALAALDAEVVVEQADGERRLPLLDLHRLPGEEPWLDTVLPHGALITAVLVPPLPAAGRSTYRKVRDRASFAFAVVSVAAVLVVGDDVVRDVRLAFGGGGGPPVAGFGGRGGAARRARGRGQLPSRADIELAAARPLRDNAYKLPLLGNVVVRTLIDLAAAPADPGRQP